MTNLTRKNILLFLPAKDFSEEEYLTIKTSILNKGFGLFITSDCNHLCVGNNGLKVKADVSLFNIHPVNFDAFVLIGGNGMRAYWNNKALAEISKRFYETGKVLGAVCCAPVVLGNAGILEDHEVTCYPKDKKELERTGSKFTDQTIVVSGNIITAQSPQDTLEFSRILLHKIK